MDSAAAALGKGLPVVFQTFCLLEIMAIGQPAGRLLGTPSPCSAPLRLSPILCALDALSLVNRCLAYCCVLRISPTKALHLIGTERFPAEDAFWNACFQGRYVYGITPFPGDDDGRSHETMAARGRRLLHKASRYSGFYSGARGFLRMAAWLSASGAQWTAAWGWMYVTSYIILELASEVYHLGLGTAQGTAQPVLTDKTAAQSNVSNSDPAANPKLPGLRDTLAYVDYALLHVVGWPVHLGLVYWAFLDLVQPSLNRHILAVDATDATAPWEIRTGWGDALIDLSSPFLLASLALNVGLVAVSAVVGRRIASRIASRFSSSGPSAAAAGPAPARFSDDVAETITAFSSFTFAGMAFILLFYFSLPHLARGGLFWARALWIYQMLSLETLVLLVFAAVASLLYRLAKVWLPPHVSLTSGSKYTIPDDGRRGVVKTFLDWLARLGRGFVTENSCTLFSAFFISFAVSICWYLFRFSEPGHWMQHWRDALQYECS